MKASRVNFANIYGKYQALGKGNVRLTQSSLYLIQDINPNKTVYNFDILENQAGTIVPEEIRLNINDEFIATEMGIYLQGTINLVEAGVSTPTNAKHLITYPLFNTDSIVASNQTMLYNGTIKVAVNNVVYMEKFDTRKLGFIPRTPFSSAVAATNSASMASNDYSNDGLYELAPMITYSGAKKNDIQLTVPQAISGGLYSFTDDNGNVFELDINKIVYVAHGLLAQNASRFQ
jgi:hypothetical protein